MKQFKPQLLPNDKAGVHPDWEERLKTPTDWLASYKLDGCRVEIAYDSPGLTRALKPIKSLQVQRMVEEVQEEIGRFGGVLEGEFWGPGMTFPEIIHFFATEDVTSDKTRKKYESLWKKTGGKANWVQGKNGLENLGWKFEGRTVDWLCSWPEELGFHMFDYVLQGDLIGKEERYDMLAEIVRNSECPHLQIIDQTPLTSVDMFYQMYDQAMISGYEGLVVIKKDAKYKNGRITEKSAQGYKAKEDNNEFDGVVLEVLEGTVAREGSEKTVNELGRSVTSKLKEDRVLSGLAKGFLVRMSDGRELTVSLTGFDAEAKRDLLLNPLEYVGKHIKFTGMDPVKPGGCPRHAHFTHGNIRDEKS